MKNNLLIGVLIGIGVLTLVNTYMLLNNDKGVDYKKTEAASPTNNIASTPANNQTANPAIPAKLDGPTTAMHFDEMDYDFGTINQDTHNTKIFTFKNTGENPLIITDAKGSCGCTVPNYPRHPIAPGETGEIEVTYSPGKQIHQQTKTVSITANTEPATTVLRIKANVVAPSTDKK